MLTINSSFCFVFLSVQSLVFDTVQVQTLGKFSLGQLPSTFWSSILDLLWLFRLRSSFHGCPSILHWVPSLISNLYYLVTSIWLMMFKSHHVTSILQAPIVSSVLREPRCEIASSTFSPGLQGEPPLNFWVMSVPPSPEESLLIW